MEAGGGQGLVGPAPRQILTDSVYDAVKALIMDDVVPPGAKLNMDALARDLAVSPTPIREALARLESERLVVKEPLRGYTTAPLLTRAAFEDLYDFRLHLEPWAAGGRRYISGRTVGRRWPRSWRRAPCRRRPEAATPTTRRSPATTPGSTTW